MKIITLCWSTHSSADDDHDDISTGIDANLIAIVSQDASPVIDGLGWHWVIEDWSYDADEDWPPPDPAVLASGYTATRQAGRTAVMGWVRQHREDNHS